MAQGTRLTDWPKRWVGRRGITWRYGESRFMLLKSGDHGFEGETRQFLYLIRNDFRDVLFMVRWPRRWWPF